MGCFGYICKGCGTPINGRCHTGGEKCVMIHVRHGKEMGRVEGHYDEYGRVIEQEGIDEELRFRGEGEGINSHYEICNSEFNMEDSYENIVDKRIYNGKVVNFRHYVEQKFYEDFDKVDYDFEKLNYANFIREHFALSESFETVYNKYLKRYNRYKNDVEVKNDDNLCFLLKDTMSSHIWTIIDEMLWVFWKRKGAFFRYEFDKLRRVTFNGYSGIVAYHSVCYNEAIKNGSFTLIPSLQDPNQSWGKVRKKYS